MLGSARKIQMLIPEYYEQWADIMEDYLDGIDDDLIRSINKGPFLQEMLIIVATAEYMITQGNKMKENYKRCLSELRGVLPLMA